MAAGPTCSEVGGVVLASISCASCERSIEEWGTDEEDARHDLERLMDCCGWTWLKDGQAACPDCGGKDA